MMADYDSPHDRYESEHHHHQQQQQHPQQQQQQRSTILERGRAIKLLRNGDPFFSGRAFVINHRKYPMLEVLLDDASQALRANFGAVRCIHTPKNGTRLRDISELEDHQTYVASGGERFKKLHYLDIAEGKRVPSKEKTPPKLPPVRRYDVEGRAMRLSRSENVIIYVYRNGDPLTLPAKILLVKATLQNWESVLDEITRKVSLTNSAVLKLYSMNGELVTSAQQLEYNGMYAAAGKERFKRIEYPDPKSFSPNSSPKMSRKSSNHQFSGDRSGATLPSRQKKRENQNNYQPSSETFHTLQQRYTKSDGSNTHTTTANSHGSIEHNGQRRPVREEYDFFNSKPQQHRRGPTKETDLDRDDGGVYKGRLNQRERVREIEDTRDTKVELPVDFREVETVEEENLYGNAGRTPRHQSQPPSQPKANSRQRSPPARTLKSPPKTNYHNNNNDYDDNNDHHNQSTNGFDNDSQRRTPSSRTKHIDNDYKRRSSPPPPPRHIDDDVDYNHQRDNQQTPPSNTHSNDKDENHAATVIQSHVRGYLTRKQTYHDKQDHNEQLTKNDSQRQSPDFNNHKQNHEQHSSSRNERRYDNDDDNNV